MALIVDQLSVARGERTVIAGLSFRAEVGTALVLTGPNGAGKTTLLRTLAGLIPPEHGSMRLEPEDAEGRSVGERAHLVGHLNAIRPALTVAENARFWCDYLGGDPRIIASALDRMALTALASVRASDLSAGQKRRLGLSRLLLAPRPLWLLDEPAVSLDQASRERLSGIVNAHLAEGGLVIAATHQPLGFTPSTEFALGRVAGVSP